MKMKRQLLWVLTATMCFCEMVLAQNPVVFNDVNLTEAVKEALGIDHDPNATEMLELDTLFATDRGISDLTGLEYATNIGYLYLWGNSSISDLSPLSELTNLRELNLRTNQISDLTALSNLTQMRELGLSHNQISDLSPLAMLTDLTILEVENNQIEDVSPLLGLTHLEFLTIDRNFIDDVSLFSGFQSLKGLSISYNGISDISPFSQLTTLTALTLRGNHVSDISPLVGLTNLTWLNLLDTDISDITALSNLTHMETLFLSYNQIEDVSSLSSLTNLKYLDLHANVINDISALSGLTELKLLYLAYGNQISDISALSGMTKLEKLTLTKNIVSDIESLGGLTNLTYLDLGSNEISDISVIANLTNLTFLNLAANHITDINPLTYLTSLEGNLSLNHNQINNISPLAGLTKLTGLNLQNNQINDISAIANLINLNSLNLSNNLISDITSLSNLTSLQGLGLEYNQITDISALAGLTNIQGLGLRYNQIVDISWLSNMTNLTDLGLENNQITSISALAELTKMHELRMGTNQISDISALTNLRNLTYLDLLDNPISDLSPLSDLINLESLWISSDQVNNILPLSNLTNLSRLLISLTQVNDLSPLAGLAGLEGLDLRNNKISDITPLLNLMNLQSLDLRYNPLNAAAYDVDFPQIQANNPGINLWYDNAIWRTLTIDSSAGGSVVTPGEGPFVYINHEVVALEAAPEDLGHVFVEWTGSAVDTGVVIDPLSASTSVTMQGDYTLTAHFEPITVLYVDAAADPNGNGSLGAPFATIQAAIDAFDAGLHDRIVVLDGIYSGAGNHDLDFLGKSVYLKSATGTQHCIIDCAGEGRGFHLHQGEDENAIIEGFTITGGTTEPGSALLCENSTPTLTHCVIRDNSPNAVWMTDDLNIEDSVELFNNNAGGPGTIRLDQTDTLTLGDCVVACQISGDGTIEIPAGQELILSGQAIANIARFEESGRSVEAIHGTINCWGSLIVQENAQLAYTDIHVADSASFIVQDHASVINNDLYAHHGHYLQVDPQTFQGSLDDNKVFLSITKNGQLEARALSDCTDSEDPFCGPGAHQLDDVPAFDITTWTLENLTLAPGVNLDLLDLVSDLGPVGGDVLYVRTLKLGAGAQLNTGSVPLYYHDMIGLTDWIIDETVYSYDIGSVGFDDANEFSNTVTTNNTDTQTLVEFVQGQSPDPTGMMYMQSQIATPARAKTYLGVFNGERIDVRFKYLFETEGPDVVLKAYLSDVPNLIDLEDNHMLFIGEILPPLSSRPGSVGSNQFGLYEKEVDVSALDPTQGLWLELILSEPAGMNSFRVMHVRSMSTSPGAFIDDADCTSHCRGICMDVTGDDVVTLLDYVVICAACGRSVGVDTPTYSPLPCLDRGCSRDGYVDALDIGTWADMIDRCPAGRNCLNLCNMPQMGGPSVVATLSSRAMPIKKESTSDYLQTDPNGLLIMGKGRASLYGVKLVGYDDLVLGFNDCNTLLGSYFLSEDRTNVRLLRDSEGNLCTINSVQGIVKADGQSILYPGPIAYDAGPQVTVGLTYGTEPTGRPLLDAVFKDEFLYVVPVVVQSNGEHPFLAAAKLKRSGNSYRVEQLYYDTGLQGSNDQNPNLSGLREIEVDDNHNVYVLNVHRQNASDILWKYDEHGDVQGCLFLDNLEPAIPDPIGLCVVDNNLFMACGQYDFSGSCQSTIYQLSTSDLSVVQTIIVSDIQQITGITSDPPGSLWVTGFSMETITENIDTDTVLLPVPYLARIPLGDTHVHSVQATCLNNLKPELMLPTSILWMGD